MENNKLVPMTEFILTQPATHDYEWQLTRIYNYANFLRQPLTLGMFLATDEDGNVLSEPLAENYKDADGDVTANWPWEYKEWCDAKECVMFEGFEYDNVLRQAYNKQAGIYCDKDILENVTHKVEDLVHYKPTLTPNALKMIYGRDI